MLKWVLLNGHWGAAALQRTVINPVITLAMLDHQDAIPQINQCGTEIVAMAIWFENLEDLERCQKEEGFVLDETTWEEVAKYGADKVAQWLLERKVPLDSKSFFKTAWKNKHKCIFRWACSHLQPIKIEVTHWMTNVYNKRNSFLVTPLPFYRTKY